MMTRISRTPKVRVAATLQKHTKGWHKDGSNQLDRVRSTVTRSVGPQTHVIGMVNVGRYGIVGCLAAPILRVWCMEYLAMPFADRVIC